HLDVPTFIGDDSNISIVTYVSCVNSLCLRSAQRLRLMRRRVACGLISITWREKFEAEGCGWMGRLLLPAPAIQRQENDGYRYEQLMSVHRRPPELGSPIFSKYRGSGRNSH